MGGIKALPQPRIALVQMGPKRQGVRFLCVSVHHVKAREQMGDLSRGLTAVLPR